TPTQTDPLSTFAIDVDTGSYTNMRQYVQHNQLPPTTTIRVEEYINYFRYNYNQPTAAETFAFTINAAPSPNRTTDNQYLIQVGVQGYTPSATNRPPALLIFVVDVSGSMDAPNRLPLVQQSLRTLTRQLAPTDQIGIVAYGDTAEIILEPTAVSHRRTIETAINQLQTNGSTYAEEGLKLAYQLAADYHQDGTLTRLILCSDGVANVGATTADTILTHAQNGIPLSTFGFGLGSYNDQLMEQLANQGDGVYAYIDTPAEANRLFKDNLLPTLMTIAYDAKIQVAFNPNIVTHYRLIGYENRAIADEDFRNDTVDAGEIGAGHQVTALYEIILANDVNPTTPASPPAEMMRVQLRFQQLDTTIRELVKSVPVTTLTTPHNQTDWQLATAVMHYAHLLREGATPADWAQLQTTINHLRTTHPDDQTIHELATLITAASQTLPTNPPTHPSYP
ncbi:MAG TPA: von Willebrand factor type A domain-containing protein, partial [Anaerolineae bacterium]|nr:von Willebrand factor type A domain-containing protein [Anaerolineae bacterium]